ncbi:MAG: alpha/beta hydrolase [Actinobacteria bacterium]|nr:alpha/beta hydrolase [Actinomycetota bacterium]
MSASDAFAAAAGGARAASRSIETETVSVEGIDTFVRRVRGEGPPTVFVHGVPTHSGDWTPFLERAGGPALAFDLPGFGRSQRPQPERFDCSVHSYGRFAESLLAELGIGEHSLVVHDWGVVALIGAQRRPQRLRRLCVIDAVPLLPGYRWHRTARHWRTPLLGELLMRLFTPRLAPLALRESRGDWGPPPRELVEAATAHLDRGTLDAILRLYRSADEPVLAQLGKNLGAIAAPALVVWAGRDRYLPARFGRGYAAALPNSELLELPEAGHWPWWGEAPGLVETVLEFTEVVNEA